MVHKPTNWTSFDVVGRIRGTLEKHFKDPAQGAYRFGRKSRLKVGHGGTLDPLATGLLVLGVGGGTKRMAEYLKGAKSYVARAQLGSETDTLDSEGATLRTAAFEHVTTEDLQRAASAFVGDIMQRPPIYSALKKDGERLYDLARAGKVAPEDVEARPVTVHRLEVSGYDSAAGAFDLEVSCSGGTYVRTLIADIAKEVGSAGHMTALERTKHGPFCTDAEATRAEAAGVAVAAGVQPVPVGAFNDAARLLEAIEEATAALGTLEPQVVPQVELASSEPSR